MSVEAVLNGTSFLFAFDLLNWDTTGTRTRTAEPTNHLSVPIAHNGIERLFLRDLWSHVVALALFRCTKTAWRRSSIITETIASPKLSWRSILFVRRWCLAVVGA